MELHCCYNHLLASTVKVSQTTHVADLPKFLHGRVHEGRQAWGQPGRREQGTD